MPLNEVEAQQQVKLLDSGLYDNPLFPSSPVPSLNKKLATNEKNSLIRAINEIFLSIDGTQRSVTAIMDQFIGVIGDYITNPALLEDLQAMAPNILSALKVLKDKLDDVYTKEEIDAKLGGPLSIDIDVVTTLPTNPDIGYPCVYKDSDDQYYLFICINQTGPTWGKTPLIRQGV